MSIKSAGGIFGRNPTFNKVTATSFVGDIAGDVTGNADTATALATARDIAGQSFDGTANITIAATDLSDTDQSLATTDDVSFNSVTADITGDVTGNVTGGVQGVASTVSYPTDNATVNLLTLNADNVAKVSLVFVDTGYRQGVWAGEVIFFVSDAFGGPALQGNVIEVFNQAGSASWSSPVVTIANSGNTLTFNATNSNSDMGGTVYIKVYFCTNYGALTFA